MMCSYILSRRLLPSTFCTSISSLVLSRGFNSSSSSSAPSSSSTRDRVLVYGGNGALGRAMITGFLSDNYHVVSVDFEKSPIASQSITLPPSARFYSFTSAQSPSHMIPAHIATILDELQGEPLTVIVNAAGGWQGGDIGAHSLFESVDKMWAMNCLSALAAAHVASYAMKSVKNPLLVFTGSAAVYHNGSPGTIGYGMAKAAIHHLISSLSLPHSSLPSSSVVVGLLPTTIDTESNRAAMPSADFGTWTPLNHFVGTVRTWAQALKQQRERPQQAVQVNLSKDAPNTDFIVPVTGGMYEFITKAGKSSIVLHQHNAKKK